MLDSGGKHNFRVLWRFHVRWIWRSIFCSLLVSSGPQFGLFGVLEGDFGQGWAHFWILRGQLWFCMWLWWPMSEKLRFRWLPNGFQNEAGNQQIATKSREKKIVAKWSKKGQIPDPLIARRKGCRPYGSHIFTFTEVSKKWSKKVSKMSCFGPLWPQLGSKMRSVLQPKNWVFLKSELGGPSPPPPT